MKQITLEQYKEIITVALDHQMAFFKGKFVLDENDFAVEQDQILRTSLERYFKQKNTGKLKKMLNQLIKVFFEFHDEFNFTEYLFEKTGYRIKPIPKEQICITDRKKIFISVSGDDENAFTCVQILLPTVSGVIYCCKGPYPNIKADWIDNNTIEITKPVNAKEVDRISRVKYHDEIFTIRYKDL
jgi:hypothetical protein